MRRTPVSAIHGALVIKASFFILLQLWLLLVPGQVAGAWVLGGLGSAAVLWGGLLAWRARGLKQVVAFSTVGQLGYLLLAFPLMIGTGEAVAALAWQGTWLQLAGHALAKAAMFMAAGNLLLATGHGGLAELAGTSRRLPLALMTFGIAAVTLMGLPPSAGFTAKWLLLQAALLAGQWPWVLVLALGTLLTAAYVFLGLAGTTAAVAGGTFGLGFQTLPVVFAQMGPIGNFIGATWFFMLFLAAITSSISMYQPALAFFEESLGWPRKNATTLMVGLCIVGSFLVMYFSKGSVFLGTLDDWFGTFLIFVLAMVQIICFSWIFGIDRGWKEAKADSEKLKATRQRRLSILNKRLKKFHVAKEKYLICETHLETIEDAIRYIYEQSITMPNAEEVGSQLDHLLSEMEETTHIIDELDQNLLPGFDNLDEELELAELRKEAEALHKQTEQKVKKQT